MPSSCAWPCSSRIASRWRSTPGAAGCGPASRCRSTTSAHTSNALTPRSRAECPCVQYDRRVPATIELHQDLRHAVRDLCKAFPDSYWRELDASRAYPDAFVRALTEAGYLAALIPEEYGGSGLGVTEASVIL